MLEIIRDVYSRREITSFGVCGFGDILPLLDVRAKGRLPDAPASVITCALPYYCGEFAQRNVARYAICDDYHIGGGGLLSEISAELARRFPGRDFVSFIDVSPIRECKAAGLSGLGQIGLHGQLITQQWGAWVFIGCVVTNLYIPRSRPVAGFCPGCERCIKACPTGALSRAGLRRELCRSAITQKKGGLSLWEQSQIRAGKMAWGCDICLEACPKNQNAVITPLECMRRSPLPILSSENLDAAIGRKAYGYRGKKVLERNLALIK